MSEAAQPLPCPFCGVSLIERDNFYEHPWDDRNEPCFMRSFGVHKSRIDWWNGRAMVSATAKADWLDHFAQQFSAADQGMLRSIAASLRVMTRKPASATEYEGPRDPRHTVRVRGVGRVADEPRALLLALTERPTDDEIRALHEFFSQRSLLDAISEQGGL